MTEKELIIDFINRLYILKINAANFVVCEKDKRPFKGRKLMLAQFKYEVALIFGFNKDKDFEFIEDWIDNEREKLTRNLTAYFKSLDLSEGSIVLETRVLEYINLTDDSKFTNEFIVKYFSDYYFDKVVRPTSKRNVK